MELDLSWPFIGRWLVRNSPADRVPSHGTNSFASAYAVDFVPVNDLGRSAPLRLRSLMWTEPPDRFPGFGRTLLAPTEGVVVATHDGELDHPAYRGLPSVAYALTQGRRAAQGWVHLAGNHVLIQSPRGPVVVLCHLKRHSIRVHVGQTVGAGEALGQCGNSGNSTEPHVHVQAIDRLDVMTANPVSITFNHTLPQSGVVIDAR